MIEDPHIQETTLVMQTTMLDILQRRAVMQGLEYRALEKKVPDSLTLRVYGNDYLRSQLLDLRKFFENNNKSYRMTDLIALVGGKPSEATYDALRTRWEDQFKDIAHKFLFHLERGYTPPDGVSTQSLDALIDDINRFLDEVVRDLTAAQYSVGSLARNPNDPYFQDTEAEAIEFFKMLGD